METNITPLKDTMLKREANYLSSGPAQLGEFTPSKGQYLNQSYSPEKELCWGHWISRTGRVEDTLHCATTAQN